MNSETLARRAVACRAWRWLPGMVTTTGVRILRRDDDGYTIGYGPRTSYCVMQVFPDALPDLSDPPTLGALLALVREAHNAPHAWVEVRYGQRARVLSPDNFSEGARMLSEWQIGTEAAALVAALEAAP